MKKISLLLVVSFLMCTNAALHVSAESEVLDCGNEVLAGLESAGLESTEEQIPEEEDGEAVLSESIPEEIEPQTYASEEEEPEKDAEAPEEILTSEVGDAMEVGADSGSIEIVPGEIKDFHFSEDTGSGRHIFRCQIKESGLYYIHAVRKTGTFIGEINREGGTNPYYLVVGLTEDKVEDCFHPLYFPEGFELIIGIEATNGSAEIKGSLSVENADVPVLCSLEIEKNNLRSNNMTELCRDFLLTANYQDVGNPVDPELRFQEYMTVYNWPSPYVDEYGNSFVIIADDDGALKTRYLNHGTHTFHVIVNEDRDIASATAEVPFTEEELIRNGISLSTEQTEYSVDPDQEEVFFVFDKAVLLSGTYRFDCGIPASFYPGFGSYPNGAVSFMGADSRYLQHTTGKTHDYAFYGIKRKDWSGNSLTVHFQKSAAVKSAELGLSDTVVQPVASGKFCKASITYQNGDKETLSVWKIALDHADRPEYLYTEGMHGERFCLRFYDADGKPAFVPGKTNRLPDGRYTCKLTENDESRTLCKKTVSLKNGTKVLKDGQKFSLKKGESAWLYLPGPQPYDVFRVWITPTADSQGSLNSTFFINDRGEPYLRESSFGRKETISGNVGYYVSGSSHYLYGIYLTVTGDSPFSGTIRYVAEGKNLGKKSVESMKMKTSAIKARHSGGYWNIPVEILYKDGSKETLSKWVVPDGTENTEKPQELIGLSANYDRYVLALTSEEMETGLFFPKTQAELRSVSGKKIIVKISDPDPGSAPGFLLWTCFGNAADAPVSQTLSVPDYKKPLNCKPFKLSAVVLAGNKKGKLTYASHNPRIAAVDSKGKVTVKAIGETYITITSPKCSGYKTTKIKAKITVNPPRITFSKLQAAGKGKVNLNWNNLKGISGCQVQYATNRDFKKARIKTFGAKAARNITGLKQNQYYCFRIRTFKTINGVKKYSSWSEVMQIKVK
ncbi:MAG: Ig-like domain-containing protein [Blautia sp.]|nr:Ig-like domain-containing protein [Blautia sp.]